MAIPIKKMTRDSRNKNNKEKAVDLESNLSESMIIKPANRGYDRRQSSSIERFNRRASSIDRFNRQSSSIDRYNRQSSSIDRFNRQSSSIDRFQRILHPKSRGNFCLTLIEVPRSLEKDSKKSQKCQVSQAVEKLCELVHKNEEEKEHTGKSTQLRKF